MGVETKKYWKKVITLIILSTASMSIGAILLIPFKWPLGFIIWFVSIASGGLFLIVRWHAKNTAYICPECGHRFMISTFKDFISPHMLDKKLLRCPECKKRSWCRAISAKEVSGK